jgi:glycyl-tRNA synthetase beta chain
MSKKDLVFEIGTEELPAASVPRALASLEGYLREGLGSARIAFDSVRGLGTPRRLALIAEGLSDSQPDAVVEVRGPQTRAAYDAGGRPTKALEGFARAQGLRPEDLKTIKTDKGEYVCATRKIKGRKTLEALPEVLKGLLSREVFPRSMRWGPHEVSFGRPVHWLLAVYGRSVVEFEWGHLKSSAGTYGHRFLSGPASTKGGKAARPGLIRVNGASSYMEGLRAANVIVDPAERRTLIAEGLKGAAVRLGGRVLEDDALLDEVTHLVECPVVAAGSFDREFLGLPREVVISAMREHQRYFTVVDATGALMAHFITVANTPAEDMGAIVKGNERVLRARLNDAKFYYEQDRRKGLPERVEALKGVVFQARLGTSYEKVERFTRLALHMGARLGCSMPADKESPSDFLSGDLNPASFDRASVDPGFYAKLALGRASMLCKADLTTGMVGEFPKLQGVIGGIYASREGEAQEVSEAIYGHYLPIASGGALPGSVLGAIISVADKLDTISGCFGVGLNPSGAHDPYAIRRQALGVIAIIMERGFRTPLDELVEASLQALKPRLARDALSVKADVLEFFKERLRNQLMGQGLPFDTVDAVLSAPWYDMADAVKRVKALEGFKGHPSSAGLVIAFKRVSNILKGIELGSVALNPALFEDPRESALHDAAMSAGPAVESARERGDYAAALEALASIKESVDEFFDHVMVMVEDEALRLNRLSLLDKVRGLYARMADLSRLAVREEAGVR